MSIKSNKKKVEKTIPSKVSRVEKKANFTRIDNPIPITTQEYITPEMEIIEFECEDIITASNDTDVHDP